MRLGEKGEGIKQKQKTKKPPTNQQLIDTENRMAITRGKGQ